MRLCLELYASLMKYLPADADRHRVWLEIASGTTPHAVLAQCRVPRESAHLVLRNGVYLSPEERDHDVLRDNDVLAVWPPVAGG